MGWSGVGWSGVGWSGVGWSGVGWRRGEVRCGSGAWWGELGRGGAWCGVWSGVVGRGGNVVWRCGVEMWCGDVVEVWRRRGGDMVEIWARTKRHDQLTMLRTRLAN